MSEATIRTVKEYHIIFLRNIMVKREQRNTYGTWETPVAGEVLRESGMQTVKT